MDSVLEGNARLTIPGGRNFQFASQRVIPCSETTLSCLGYSPLSVLKNDLRQNLNSPELVVDGMVFDTISKHPLSDARIEIWHRSPTAVDHYQRACLTADNRGKYRFVADWPEREKGRNYFIFFKINYRHQSFFTKLTFNQSLALISELCKTSNSRNHLMGTKPSMLSKRMSASFKFDIGIPLNGEELPLAQNRDLQTASI